MSPGTGSAPLGPSLDQPGLDFGNLDFGASQGQQLSPMLPGADQTGVTADAPGGSSDGAGPEGPTDVGQVSDPPPLRDSKPSAADLIARTRLAERLQLERVQVLVDAATLAAHQVSDARLSLLEAGRPQATVLPQWMIDVLVGIATTAMITAVASGVGELMAGLVLADMAASDVLAVAGSEVSGADADLLEFSWWLERKTRGGIDAATFVASNLTEDELSVYQRQVQATLATHYSAQAGKYAGPVVGAAAKQLAQALVLPSPGAPGRLFDTPDVAVLGAAYSWAAGQRIRITDNYASIAAQLQAKPNDPSLRDFAADAVDIRALPSELDEIRAEAAMLIEIEIWFELCGFRGGVKDIVKDPQSSLWTLPKRDGTPVDPRLATYWYLRFRPLIELLLPATDRRSDAVHEFVPDNRQNWISDVRSVFNKIETLRPAPDAGLFRTTWVNDTLYTTQGPVAGPNVIQ